MKPPRHTWRSWQSSACSCRWRRVPGHSPYSTRAARQRGKFRLSAGSSSLPFLIVAAVMWVLIVWAAKRNRGSLAEHAPPDIGGGHRWILIGGFAIPFIILSVMFVWGMEMLGDFPLHDGNAAEPDITVIGHQWWWQVQYVQGPPNEHFTTANEIHIPVGRYINVELKTADVIHSFWVPELHGKVDMIPGQPNMIRIRADHAGTFRGECGEYCGAQHAHMILYVVASGEQEYQTWRNHELQPATSPATEEQVRGQEVFLSAPCAFCHTIRGTDAHGGVAPDLTHIASRRGIAANALDNNAANMAAWITHAQSLKPEVMMPNLTEFTGRQLQDMVAYLEHLN